MPGYPAAPLTVTVTDTLANIAPSVGNAANYYVWLGNEGSGTIYGPSTKTAAAGSWTITGVPLGTYKSFYGQEPVSGVAPTSWQAQGAGFYEVATPRYCTIPQGSMSAWQTALANTSTAIVTVWNMGASPAEGSNGVTDVMTKPTFYQWRGLKIAQGYPTFGDFCRSTQSQAHSSNNSSASGFPFTHAQTAGAFQKHGPWWLPTWTQTAGSGGDMLTYTHPTTAFGYRGRSFRIYYWDPGVQDGGADIGAGVTWGYKLGVGATQTVTLTRTNTIKYVEITSATPGWTDVDGQVIHFVTQSAASTMFIIGVLSCPGTTIGTNGICYVQLGQTGDCLGDFGARAPINVYPGDKIARYIGPSNAAPLFTADATLSPPFAPDLAILEVFDDPIAVMTPGGVVSTAATPNYTVQGCYPDEYMHVLRRMTQAFRGKATGCTIVHALANIPDSTTSDTNIAAASQVQNFWHYFWAHRTVADLNDDVLIKTDPEWGERALALGFLSAANPHPNNAGALNRAQKWQAVGL